MLNTLQVGTESLWVSSVQLLLLLTVGEVLSLMSWVSSKVWRDPSWAADVVGDVTSLLLHSWYTLNGGRSVTNDGDLLSSPIVVLVPSCGVDKLSLEVVESLN